MAKKYYEGTDYTFNTDWGKEETTGLPLSGGAVQQVIKDKVAEIETSLGKKVGYIRENEIEGKVYFYTSQDAYENGETAVGSVVSSSRYSMSIKLDENNKYTYLSEDTNKNFVWYFKTVKNDNKEAFPENVSVEYNIKNEAEGIDTLYSTTIKCVQDPKNENYTKVEMNLDEYLTNGKSTIGISIRGLNTKESNALNFGITIITLSIEDRTDFSVPVVDNFIATTDVTCTKLQDYFYEYRIDEIGDFILDSTAKKGTGSKNTINYYVNLKDIADGKHVFEYRILVKIDSDVEPYYTSTQRIEFIKGTNVAFNEPQILIYSTYSSKDTPKTENGELIINGVSQYIPYTLKYAVYNSEVASTNVEFIEIVKNKEMAPVSNTVENNTIAEFGVQAMESGEKYYKIITKDSEDEVTNGEGRYFYMNVESSTLNIGVYNTNLRVDFSSISKSNDSQDKDTWVSTVGTIFSNKATFNKDFDWSQGWTDNGLVISEGCEVTFDYAPFPQQKSDATSQEKLEFVGGENAYTFEIEFMTQNVTDEDAVVCDMLSEVDKTYVDEEGVTQIAPKCGLVITGSEFKFTTPNGESVSTRFKANEMNRATIVIRPQRTSKGAFKGLVELYMNGAISNVAKYTDIEQFEVEGKDALNNTISKNLTFRGTPGADIVVKYIRAYNGAMDGDDIVNNYIVYRTDAKQMLNLYNKNNVINDSGVITPQSVIDLGNIPVLVFVGRTNDKELAYGDGNTGDGKGNCDEEYKPGTIDANEENWYQTLENTTNKKKNIDMDVIYYNPLDKSKNFKFIKAYITPQGTSSMYYPKKNYRIYTQKNKDTRCFFSLVDENKNLINALEFEDMMRWNFGENEKDRIYEKWRGKENYKKRKYAFKDNSQAVKCWCLKADFAETSSSHNTGVARLWGETLRNSTAEVKKDTFKSVFKTNAQATTEAIYNNNINGDMPDVRTTIDGFPIVCFGKKSYSDEYVFLGKYNFNNDKSTESVFGFCDIDDKNELIDNGRPTIADQVFGEVEEVKHTLDDMLDQYMSCVETLDNGNALANFSTIEEFDDKWEDAFEFRYPEIVEEPDKDDYKDKNGNIDEESYKKDYAKYLVDLEYWKNTHLKPFRHFAQWLIDTRWCDVDGNILPGLSKEEAARRKEKFAVEKWDHLDVWKMAAYYIYAMRFGAVDQIVKNSMLTSEGPFAYNKTGDKYGYWDTTEVENPEYGRYYKWYYINYDNDTVLGVKNDGSLAYGPEINRRMKEGSGETASYIYAGSTSTLWNNFDQDEEFQEIVRIADQGISKTMTYKKAISMFDDEQVGKWCERIYNKDADYKYLSPYIADWTYTGDDDNVEAFVDKLFMLQGPRTAHRRWWMSKRFSLFDGKWNSGDFATKFVEVKCDYSAIGDTFSAVAGANAYFGYQINNKIFDVNDGEPEYMGGATTEFAANERIPWKLYKNIQIGDPIAIFGSTDMLELNLGGLSKNLSSVVFKFGNNTDIVNKLETLNVSVPDEWLFSNASYEIYSDDEKGTVNWKSGYDKIKLAFPDYITSEADFEEGGKYPTSDVELEATADSPMFYRTKVTSMIDDEEITVFVYFAKKTGGIRNYSCKGISFDSLDKLQDLRMAGYMNVPSINLSNNKFINSVDVRYSSISNITFAEGARIKELKASSALSELSFNRCNNVKLNKIMIDNMPLRDNGGKNFNFINVVDSDGLNHDNEFKTFILRWMIGGKGYKANPDRKLVLKGINWTNVTIDNIKTILDFASGDSLTGANKAKECVISGTIAMAQENLSQDDIALIEKLKNTTGINLYVKISFASIFINGPETIIAGDPNAVFRAQIYPNDIELGNTKINFKVNPIGTTTRKISWEWKKDEENMYDGQYTQIYLTSEETLEDSVKVEVVAQLVAEGGSDETNTKQTSMTTLVEKPTYPSQSKSSIVGNLTIKLGNTYTFKVHNLDDKGVPSTGTYQVEWSCDGNGLEHVTTGITGNDLTITVIKDIEMVEGAEPAKGINLSAKITPTNGELFTLNSITQVLSDSAVISRATHPEIMNALSKVKGWDDSKFAMSRSEAHSFTNDDLVQLNEYLKGMKNQSSNSKISFVEFTEFTGITELPNDFFADSDLVEIALPNSLENIGKVNGYNEYNMEESQGTGLFSGCTKLTNITFPNNEFFNKESEINGNITLGIVFPDYFCFGCTSLTELTLPKGTVYIGDYTFGKTNIKKLDFPSTTRKLGKVFAANDEGTDTVIEEITIPAFCTTLDPIAFQATSLKKIYVEDNDAINNLYFVDAYGCLISYVAGTGNILVRMPSLNEIYDEDDNLITEYDFSSSNFSYDVIGVNAFRNNQNATKIILNAAKWNTQSGLIITEKPDKNDKMIKSGINYNALFEGCPNLVKVMINSDYVVEGSIITDRCFCNCPKLEKISLVNGFNYIGEYSFYNNNITELILPDTIKKVSNYFISNCPRVENIILNRSLTGLDGYLIDNLSSLKTITLPHLFKNPYKSFVTESCDKLEEFILPDGYAAYAVLNGEVDMVLFETQSELNTYLENYPDYRACDGYKVVNGILYNKDMSEIVKIPYNVKTEDNVLVLPESVEFIMDGAGRYLSSVEEIIFPTALRDIQSDGLMYCRGLKKVDLSNCMNLSNIGASAFYGAEACEILVLPNRNINFGQSCFNKMGILKMVIPDEITKLSNMMFYSNQKMEEIVFGSGLTEMGTYVISTCPRIKTITFKSQKLPKILDRTFKQRPGQEVMGDVKKIQLLNGVEFDSEYWDLLITDNEEWPNGVYPYRVTRITMEDILNEVATYGLRNVNKLTISTLNNGEPFIAQEMYLIDTTNGDKFVGIKDGDNYYIPEASKIYVGREYAVMISKDGLSYTFADLITMNYDEIHYIVDAMNGMNPYYDVNAVATASMSLDDDMMSTSNTPTVSKYEYDVLVARLAQLEKLIQNL